MPEGCGQGCCGLTSAGVQTDSGTTFLNSRSPPQTRMGRGDRHRAHSRQPWCLLSSSSSSSQVRVGRGSENTHSLDGFREGSRTGRKAEGGQVWGGREPCLYGDSRVQTTWDQRARGSRTSGGLTCLRGRPTCRALETTAGLCLAHLAGQPRTWEAAGGASPRSCGAELGHPFPFRAVARATPPQCLRWGPLDPGATQGPPAAHRGPGGGGGSVVDLSAPPPCMIHC